MNKSDLIAAIADHADVSKTIATATLDAFIETVTEAISKGESVQLVGFGTFSSSPRAARIGRNPSSGAEIKIAASTVAKFKVGAKLKEAANKVKSKGKSKK